MNECVTHCETRYRICIAGCDIVIDAIIRNQVITIIVECVAFTECLIIIIE